MRSEVRRVLDVIDDVMVKAPYAVRKDLWSILTALRSEDIGVNSPESYLPTFRRKEKFTVPVRQAAFPRLTAHLVNVPMEATAIFDTSHALPHESEVLALYAERVAAPHYIGHVVDAVRAIHAQDEVK